MSHQCFISKRVFCGHCGMIMSMETLDGGGYTVECGYSSCKEVGKKYFGPEMKNTPEPVWLERAETEPLNDEALAKLKQIRRDYNNRTRRANARAFTFGFGSRDINEGCL